MRVFYCPCPAVPSGKREILCFLGTFVFGELISKRDERTQCQVCISMGCSQLPLTSRFRRLYFLLRALP